MKRSIWVVSIAIILLITLWIYTHSQGVSERIENRIGEPTILLPKEVQGVSETEIQHSKSHPAASHVAASPAPLPSENAPLADVLHELVGLSNSGSAAASIRLFRDLRKCDLRRGALSVLNGVYYHRPGQTDAEYEKQVTQKLEHEPELKKALDQLNSTDNVCAGVSSDVIEARGEYLRKAALQNDPEAAVCYATSYELGPKYLSDAWFDYAARWQQEAPYFAQRALDAGQPGILAPLIDAYMPADPNTTKSYSLSEAVGPNPMLAYALSLLYTRLAHGGELQQAQNNLVALSSQLQSSQIADAQQLANALWPRFQQAGDPGQTLATCAEFLSLRTDTVSIQEAQ